MTGTLSPFPTNLPRYSFGKWRQSHAENVSQVVCLPVDLDNKYNHAI